LHGRLISKLSEPRDDPGPDARVGVGSNRMRDAIADEPPELVVRPAAEN
jgi:hypothetical protein